jgi:hypothetical protein
VFVVYCPVRINISQGGFFQPAKIRLTGVKIYRFIPGDPIIVQGYKNNSTEAHGYDKAGRFFEKIYGSGFAVIHRF